MPSHIYSILGMWEDSVHSNVAARKAAEDYWAKNSPGKTAPSLPHFYESTRDEDYYLAGTAANRARIRSDGGSVRDAAQTSR
jgi:hypothetical protein